MRSSLARSLMVLAVSWAAALTVQGCGLVEPQEPPSIVMITVDTLRADHLSTYDYFRQTSPILDEFARQATLFERAYTAMATTLPAHASLMTSTRTTTHGLKGNLQHLGVALDDEQGLRTTAEILSDLGYQTAAFVSAAPVKSHTGMQRGFVTFDQPIEKERRADATTDRVLAWLEGTDARPYFLWVHLFDPHRPREPPSPYDEAFTTDDSLLEFMWERGVKDARDSHLQGQNNAYDGEILFTDSQIGRIFAVLKARGDWHDSAVVVTADHGEGLRQHDWMDHGKIYNEQLSVPLIIKFPTGRGPAGARIETVASLIDVLPTLVAALDLSVAETDRAQFEGIDLLAGPEARPGVLSEQSHRVAEPGLHYTLTSRKWKFFYRTEGDDELYDLIQDPHELDNVVDRYPEIATNMRDEILDILADARREAPGQPGEILDTEVIEQLEALGYLGGGATGETSGRFNGMAVWGHEVRELRPCGSATALWVIDETGELWERYKEATTGADPYRAIYVELTGELQPPPAEGFGADYEGSLRVTEVWKLDPAVAECGAGS